MPNVIFDWSEYEPVTTPVGYYVYGWACIDWGGVYFYVGKGTGSRYKVTHGRSHAFQAILKKWRCTPVILVEGLTEAEAWDAEDRIKQEFIFERGYPIMDGEGKSLRNQSMAYAKRKKKLEDPNFKVGRKPVIKPDNYEDIRAIVERGEMPVTVACKELGISRSLWYKWAREAA